MNEQQTLTGLAEEMLAMEAETFEVEDFTNPSQLLGDNSASACCSSTTSTSCC